MKPKAAAFLGVWVSGLSLTPTVMGALLCADVRRAGFSLSLLPDNRTWESPGMASAHPEQKIQGSGERHFCTWFSLYSWAWILQMEDWISPSCPAFATEPLPPGPFLSRYYKPSVVLLCFTLPSVVPWYFWDESIIISFFIPAILRYTVGLNCTWLVNSAAHMFGNRPYDQNINPRENPLVSLGAIGMSDICVFAAGGLQNRDCLLGLQLLLGISINTGVPISPAPFSLCIWGCFLCWPVST